MSNTTPTTPTTPNDIGGTSAHHQHDEAGLPEHRCSATEGIRDALVLRAMQHSRTARDTVPLLHPPLLQRLHCPIYDVNKSHAHTPHWVARCRSTHHVMQAVEWSNQKQIPARACGSGHSWSAVADVPNGGLRIDTRDMSRLLWWSSEKNTAGTVCVQPGMSVRCLVQALQCRGVCLPCLPILLQQTIGGAVSTGSHGSSLMYGSLSDQIVGLVLVTLAGKKIVLNSHQHSDLFKAATLGCGRLGVLTEIQLKVVPMYSIAKKEIQIDMTNIKVGCARILEHAKVAEHCWVHWPLGSPAAVALVLVRVADGDTQGGGVYNGKNWFPLQPEHQLILKGSTARTKTHQTKELCLSMQYAFPLDQLSSALSTVAHQAVRDGHENKTIEIKFMAQGSGSLLGGNNEGPVACINLWWPLPVATAFQSLQGIEQAMQDVGGRPHFGKLHRCSTQYIASVVPGLKLFEKMEQQQWKHRHALGHALQPHYLCFVTNKAYAPGAVCLAQSLRLVGSRARLRVIATSMSARDALLAEAAASPLPPPMDVVLELTALPTYDNDKTHNGKGATLAVDAPRRCLFDDAREGWILLDADLIAIQNPDEVLHVLQGTPGKLAVDVSKDMYASANFRIKKKKFGDVDAGSNFNAGMMVVPRPLSLDGVALQALVDAAGEDDTEELLMNDLFQGRCGSLPRGFNVPKRVMQHAPELWKEMIAKKEIVFLHYMGAKPWMVDLEKRKNADWESEAPAYPVLEKVWWKLRRGELVVDEDGGLHGSLPVGVGL